MGGGEKGFGVGGVRQNGEKIINREIPLREGDQRVGSALEG